MTSPETKLKDYGMSFTVGVYIVFPDGREHYLFNYPLNDADAWCQCNMDLLEPGNRFKIGLPKSL